jgi:hypothetical protein
VRWRVGATPERRGADLQDDPAASSLLALATMRSDSARCVPKKDLAIWQAMHAMP